VTTVDVAQLVVVLTTSGLRKERAAGKITRCLHNLPLSKVILNRGYIFEKLELD
jgi:hypothetical protein